MLAVAQSRGIGGVTDMSFAQYDAYPTTWDEFLEAIQQDETAVHLPENAEWDVGQTHPEGYTDTIFLIKCDRIYGNGATVKNLKLTNSYFRLTSTASASEARLEFWDSLNLLNMVISNGYDASADRIFMGGQRPNTIDGEPVDIRYTQCNNSAFSGMVAVPSLGGSAFQVFGQMEMWRCACNFELLLRDTAGVTSYSLGRRQDYCNFKVSAQGFTEVYRAKDTGSGASYSWFDIYGDDITKLSITWKMQACAIRCSSRITTVEAADQGFPTVVATPDPEAVVLPQDSNLIPCTDAQLRDEEWLHAAGFPIGVPETAPE